MRSLLQGMIGGPVGMWAQFTSPVLYKALGQLSQHARCERDDFVGQVCAVEKAGENGDVWSVL
jgi:hypothetical protein